MARRLAATAGLALMGSVVLSSAPLAPPAAARSDEAYVRAIDNVFDPGIVRVEPGQAVEWVNDGRSEHDVQADDGSWGSDTLEPADTFERAFEEPGAYPFFCSFHGDPGVGMAGTIVVGDAPLPGAGTDVGPGREPVPANFGRVVKVPGQAATIQEAVDRSEPGGMVLVDPGVYREAVTVTVPYLTIRGRDRNETILDGGFELANGIQVIEADGVVVENLTARNFVLNGFFWTGVFGYRGSYLTAHNNGDYGVYAFDSRFGRFDHSYASGSPDSGFYIGGCNPCDALITDVLAEHNLLGYSGTNAGGNLAIVNSEWRNNGAGIVPNTLDSEPSAPQRGALIAGNYVHDNNDRDAPMKSAEWAPAFGNGIIVAGGQDNLVTGNLVQDQERYGVVVMPLPDESFWVTSDNRIEENIVHRSGLSDLAIVTPTAGGDCFAGNAFHSSTPAAIELLFPCTGINPNPGGGGSMAPWITIGSRLLEDVPLPDYRDVPAPPPQEPMPGDPAAAPPNPAIPEIDVPGTYRIRPVTAIAPAGGPEVEKELTLMGMPIASSWWSLLLGLYAYLLPFVLYTSWVAVALWDLIRQESASMSHRARWMLVVLVVPFVGPLLYLGFGRSPIPRQLRLVLTAGGVVIYLAVVALSALFGG
ncbi:MAG: PLDc N-terminal domain-containing protein [Actinomycetota bacterium]